MSNPTLYIGDKNLSSWSLRPWVLMTHAGVPFEERTIKLDRKESRANIARVSPSLTVPCLTDGGLTVWDSLAICEYVADKHPEKNLWPADVRARAVARAVSAEMHSSFSNIRTIWPMNFTREGMAHLTTGGVQKEIERIGAIWENCRRDHGAGGPFLFGGFSIADAMYAPIVSRFVTYGPVKLPDLAAEYLRAIWALPAMKAWGQGAARELAGG